ncbi:dimethylarginine dimethylaminohydrolase family protein [Aegicerativicinus sediminis]|uniref:dimethylarginine dimethylaminohydrolase family protein n=1 Tax=Aegicerativicinus sediminis TaxID=2893202 RepID=UPI001E39F59B|nr:arginine deiminase family protein [Aegicerativicinus sediminis]
MLKLNVTNETNRLRSVILGTAEKNGPVPSISEAYDPKSIMHIKQGTYPKEKDMIMELDEVEKVLLKYEVQVFRPKVIPDCNQIFARDIGFVIEDKFIRANILPHREGEVDAIQHILSQIPSSNIIVLPDDYHVEGGDVMPWNDYIFVGTYYGSDYPNYITARTNLKAIDALKEIFPNKIVKTFNLRKSNTDPYNNALHLDCCFQPIGKDKAIIHKNGFLQEFEYNWLKDYFGRDNIFEITKEEMFDMNSNIFSISEETVISERNFIRLNSWLRENGFKVEEVPFSEIAKQEGLLRCSTLPLIRD